MADPCVLRSPDFYERGHAKVTCIRKIFRRIASWKQAIKKSKILLYVNKLKDFFQIKLYVHNFYNENYPFSYKKTFAVLYNFKDIMVY